MITPEELQQILTEEYPRIKWLVRLSAYPDMYEVEGFIEVNKIPCHAIVQIDMKQLKDRYLDYIGHRITYHLVKELLKK